MAMVMLNPSTADAANDDPTIRRCIAIAAREGHGGLEIMNLFAYRATAPTDLKTATDPIGPDNDLYLEALFARYKNVLAAWGVYGSFCARAETVMRMATRRGVTFSCLGRTATGQPRHPLYMPADSGILPFSG